MRVSLAASAFVAAIVGFGSTLALIVAAASAFGATQAQTASWVTAICLAKLFETGYLSWRYRMPVITAWSTAGAAVLAASSGFTMPEAVGAFIVTALLVIATAVFRPLTTLIARIPPSVASGMLAGVLVSFVIGAAKTITVDPVLVLPLMALFLVIRVFSPSLSVLAVLLAGAVSVFAAGRVDTLPAAEISTLEFIMPQFTLQAVIGLAIPVYLVTMASQNLPGLAVLRADGYDPPTGPLIGVTGLFSLLSAFFGAHATSLAAITAAICTGPDAHPDPEKRWLTGPFYAAAYAVFALFGASLVALFALMPTTLIALVAGLALIAPLANALSIALTEEKQRVAAIATFAVTASGIAVLGIGSAFWGLIAGIAVLAAGRLRTSG